MTISKEERAELRDLIHEVPKGDPNFPRWDYDGSNPFEHPEVLEHNPVDGAQHIGNLPSKWHTRLACAAVNASPKILAALDAADERIAGLEKEAKHWRESALAWAHWAASVTGESDQEIPDLAKFVATLKARVAELEAHAGDSLRAMMDSENAQLKAERDLAYTENALLKARITKLEADEVASLMSMSQEDVDKELQAAGVDPVALKARASAFVADAKAQTRIAELETQVAALKADCLGACKCGGFGGDVLCSVCAGTGGNASLQKRIAELEAAAQWRPMATAPRDGTKILMSGRGPEGTDSAVIHSANEAWMIMGDRYSDEALGIGHPDVVMGWLPIPALPEGGVK